MRMRDRAAGLAAVVVLWVAATTGASASGTSGTFSPPDPAPGGPQRPYEPDVPGPRNIDSLSVAITPDGGTRNGVRIAFDRTSRAEPQGAPAAARRFVFLFDRSISFRPASFPTCARTTIEQEGVGACTAASRIGTGTSHLYPEGTAEVLVFNTVHPSGLRGALVVIPDSNVLLELTWERVTEPYRQLGYRWALDEIVPPSPTPPQERVGTRRFQIAFGAKLQTADGRVVSFARTTAERGSVLRTGLWSEFVTGQVALPQTTSVR